MTPTLRRAVPQDAPACIALRGRTRQNAVSAERLAALGITARSWAAGIGSGATPGHVVLTGNSTGDSTGNTAGGSWVDTTGDTAAGTLAGYCFGSRATGEVLVLALLPDVEGRGLGRHLLGRVVADLAAAGHHRLFLGCSTDPASRSHGFYRHLGWRPTGRMDRCGDEVLELLLPAPG